jgi:hypothetical protein
LQGSNLKKKITEDKTKLVYFAWDKDILTLKYIHLFSSLDDSVATIEIRISAQRKNMKIKFLVFIFDQLIYSIL